VVVLADRAQQQLTEVPVKTLYFLQLLLQAAAVEEPMVPDHLQEMGLAEALVAVEVREMYQEAQAEQETRRQQLLLKAITAEQAEITA
jgi:predicted GNAT family acetyltransferase